MVEDTGSEGEFIACPQCAEQIRAKARVCRWCGFDLVSRALPTVSTVRREAVPVQTPRKSVLAAVLLALLVPGLGHFYVGSNKRGIVFLCAILATSVTYAISSRNTRGRDGAVALALFCLAVTVILQIVQIVSAGRCARRANFSVSPTDPTRAA